MPSKSLLLCLLLSTTSCATAITRPREAYILARDHGWIELTVVDAGIPARVRDIEEPPEPAEPPYCEVKLEVDGEPFLDEVVFPKGSTPPYVVDSGFRFPVPAGTLELTLEYADCHPVPGSEIPPRTARLPLNVAKDTVLALRYDGISLQLEQVKTEQRATLETVNAKLDALLQKTGDQ